MPWTKIGDELPDEARELSDAAFRTHIEALCWSNRRLLDLAINKRDLKRFAETPHPERAAEELVDMGWWQDTGDAWWIGCRFADWQVDRVVIEHRRQLSATTTRRNRLHKAGDHSMCSPQRCDAARDRSRDESQPESRDLSPGTGRDGTGNDHNGSLEGEQNTIACERCSSTPSRFDSAGRRLCRDCAPYLWEAA
jgi:hypothetical protein